MKSIELPYTLLFDFMSFKLKKTFSISDLSDWLNSKTDNQFIIIEKELLIEVFKALKKHAISTNELNEKLKKHSLWYNTSFHIEN